MGVGEGRFWAAKGSGHQARARAQRVRGSWGGPEPAWEEHGGGCSHAARRAAAAWITHFELMYCDLSAPCQLQADCPVSAFLYIAFNTAWLCGWMNGRRKLPDAQTRALYTFPFTAHQDPGARSGYSARTDRTRPGSLPDGRPALQAPSSTVCVPTACKQPCQTMQGNARLGTYCAQPTTPGIATERAGFKCTSSHTKAPAPTVRSRPRQALSVDRAGQTGSPRQARGQAGPADRQAGLPRPVPAWEALFLI